MNNSEFDQVIDRRHTHTAKWGKYQDRDVLPFWVADMEFQTPRFILDAVADRLNHGVLGYTRVPPDLRDAFLAWLAREYGWSVDPSHLVWLTGVVPGLNLSAMAVAEPGGSILIPTPVYYPFLDVPANADQEKLEVPMARAGQRWEIDFDALDAAVKPGTRLLMICNPQNPTGRAYTAAELSTLAAFCERHDLILCSDEIHCGLVLDPACRHVPIASLDADIAARTISLFAATKTYNMPGLSCAVAVIADQGLRRRFRKATRGLIGSPGPLAFAASTAAFADTGGWRPGLIDYLRGNAARVAETVAALPGLSTTPVEATYLAWIDTTGLALDDPGTFFEQHGLGLSDGAQFAGPGFVRFNFACPRSLLDQGLERLRAAVASATGGSGQAGER